MSLAFIPIRHVHVLRLTFPQGYTGSLPFILQFQMLVCITASTYNYKRQLLLIFAQEKCFLNNLKLSSNTIVTVLMISDAANKIVLKSLLECR